MYSGNRSGSSGNGLFAAASAASVLLLLMPYMLMFSSGTSGLVGIAEENPAVEGDGDPYEHAWHFWWVSRAIAGGHDPRFCPLIYAPEGASLAYDHVGWFDTLIFGFTGLGRKFPGLSHSLSLLMGTLLTGIFGWLLARSWGAERYGALFTALALAWLPARTAHLLQHYQIAGCWALPGALWAATLYLKKGGRAALAAFATLALAGGLESPFISLFILACLPAVCFLLRGSWKRTGIMALSWTVPTVFLGILAATSPGASGPLAPDWREAVYWAAEPQSFLLPSPFGTAGSLTGMPMRMSWMSNTFEGVVTPGLSLLFLFGFYSFRKRSWRTALVVGVFWLLSLGPELRLLGRPLGIPLPFRVLQFLPLLGGIRAPSRFAIPGGLFVALAAGMAVSGLKGRWRYAAFALLLLELALPSLPTLSDRVPGACREVPDGSTVLELPVDRNIRMYSWFQTRGDYSRRYAFMARLPDYEDPGLTPEGADEPGVVLMYHRWLYSPEERRVHDEELTAFFPDGSGSDSVWVTGGTE